MFGSAGRVRDLEGRVGSFEARLARLEARFTGAVAGVEEQVGRRLDDLLARLDDDPEARARFLLSSVADDLGRELRRLVEDATGARSAAAEIARLRDDVLGRGGRDAPRRREVELNRVYQAEATGYLSVFFDGGVTDRVTLLAGPDNPPYDRVCELNTRSDINSYAGTVVRRGEYWLAESIHEKGSKKSGVKCVFTPFL